MDLINLLVAVLIIFYGTAYISFSAKRTGLFALIAEKTLLGKWSGWKLSAVIFLVSGLLCFLTDNDVVILTITPMLLHLHGPHDIRKLLLVQFAGANTFSVFSHISNPTNVIITSRFDIDYLQFLEIMWPIGVIAAVIVIIFIPKARGVINLRVRKRTKPNTQSIISGLGIAALLTLLATSRLSGVSITLAVITILVIFVVRDASSKSFAKTMKELPIRPALVILAGFALLVAMNYFGATQYIATWLSGLPFAEAGLIVLISSVLLAAVIVNIPMSIIMSNILLLTSFEGSQQIALVSLVFLTSDVSTLVFRRASLAGHMWQHMIEDDDGKNISRSYFAKNLAPAGIAAMIAGLLFVLLNS